MSDDRTNGVLMDQPCWSQVTRGLNHVNSARF